MRTPCRLPERMLRARGSLPPIRLLTAAPLLLFTSTPLQDCDDRAVVPAASRPMLLPWMVLPLALENTSIWLAKLPTLACSLPEITLPAPVPGVSVSPPIVLEDPVSATPPNRLPSAALPAAFVPI